MTVPSGCLGDFEWDAISELPQALLMQTLAGAAHSRQPDRQAGDMRRVAQLLGKRRRGGLIVQLHDELGVDGSFRVSKI